MITIDLNVGTNVRKFKIRDEILLNAVLSENEKIVRRIIKQIKPFYKIDKSFYEVVNSYVDFTSEGVSIYAGLIVRTGSKHYAVLYLEGSEPEEEYMLKLIDNFIRENDNDNNINEIDIDKFEVSREIFLMIMQNV